MGGIAAAGAGASFLQSYHQAIEQQEKAPGATKAYDQGLEHQFDLVKASVTGQGGAAGDSGAALSGTLPDANGSTPDDLVDTGGSGNLVSGSK